jgi:hypothetical protein
MEKLILSVHSQYGYGKGVGEEQITERLEESDADKILLEDEDEGDIYGERELYDLIISKDENNGRLEDSIANVIEEKYDEVEVIGMYGNECVRNAVNQLDNAEANLDAVVDQDIEDTYVISDKLEESR